MTVSSVAVVLLLVHLSGRKQGACQDMVRGGPRHDVALEDNDDLSDEARSRRRTISEVGLLPFYH